MHSSSRAGGRRWSGVVRDSPTYVGLMPVTLQTALPSGGVAPMVRTWRPCGNVRSRLYREWLLPVGGEYGFSSGVGLVYTIFLTSESGRVWALSFPV